MLFSLKFATNATRSTTCIAYWTESNWNCVNLLSDKSMMLRPHIQLIWKIESIAFKVLHELFCNRATVLPICCFCTTSAISWNSAWNSVAIDLYTDGVRCSIDVQRIAFIPYNLSFLVKSLFQRESIRLPNRCVTENFERIWRGTKAIKTTIVSISCVFSLSFSFVERRNVVEFVIKLNAVGTHEWNT